MMMIVEGYIGESNINSSKLAASSPGYNINVPDFRQTVESSGSLKVFLKKSSLACAWTSFITLSEFHSKVHVKAFLH